MLDSHGTIFGLANVHVETGNGRDTFFLFFPQVLQLESLLAWWRPGLPFFGENRRDEMKRTKRECYLKLNGIKLLKDLTG